MPKGSWLPKAGLPKGLLLLAAGCWWPAAGGPLAVSRGGRAGGESKILAGVWFGVVLTADPGVAKFWMGVPKDWFVWITGD